MKKFILFFTTILSSYLYSAGDGATGGGPGIALLKSRQDRLPDLEDFGNNPFAKKENLQDSLYGKTIKDTLLPYNDVYPGNIDYYAASGIQESPTNSLPEPFKKQDFFNETPENTLGKAQALWGNNPKETSAFTKVYPTRLTPHNTDASFNDKVKEIVKSYSYKSLDDSFRGLTAPASAPHNKIIGIDTIKHGFIPLEDINSYSFSGSSDPRSIIDRVYLEGGIEIKLGN